MNRLPVAERREQLVEAALAVASRDGIDAATVRAVAAEAGVSLGVVHYCFQDKDELMRAMAQAITSLNVPEELLTLPAGVDIETAVDSVMQALWAGIAASRGPQLLSYELTTTSLRHAELNQVAIEQYRGQWTTAEKVLGVVARAAGVRWTQPVDAVARTVVAQIDGTSLAWLVDGDDDAALATLRSCARYIAGMTEPDDRPGVGTGAGGVADDVEALTPDAVADATA